jgi:hypothetical protein
MRLLNTAMRQHKNEEVENEGLFEGEKRLLHRAWHGKENA